MRILSVVIAAVLWCGSATAASKPHVVSLGKQIPVKLFVGPSEDKSMDITVRALYVDTNLKEFTTGKTHDITDRDFVVRRAFRVNDSLPGDSRKNPKWLWQRGGWLLVNRVSGKITSLRLSDFDPFYSEVSWYRDYAAYCGVTGNGERVTAIVAQVGNRKPLYRKELGAATVSDKPEANCAPPGWTRQPARVTFRPAGGEAFTVTVSGRLVDENVDSSPED